MSPVYRYQVAVEIPSTEVAVLHDALDGPDLSIKSRVGDEPLERQLEEQRLHVDVTSKEPWIDFEKEMRVLSSYLSDLFLARQMKADDHQHVSGELILAHRGESERVPLHVAWDADAEAPYPLEIDKPAAEARIGKLAPWARAWLVHHP